VKDWRKVLTPEQLARIPQVIPRGEMVRVVIAAAECDPERFPDPDALDITRTANRHLALGKGIHHCLGALLARMEGQIAIGTLLMRMPGFHVRGGRRVRSVLTVMYLTMPTRRPAAARGRYGGRLRHRMILASITMAKMPQTRNASAAALERARFSSTTPAT
jgi:cytochrome P450